MRNTKNLRIRPTLRGLVLALALTALSSQVAPAHPYASGITNNSGTIKFLLNENADSVKVVFDNGTSATNDLTVLGQTNKGINSFVLGAHTNYSIIVAKVGTGTPTQLSVDTNPLVNFYAPRGVVVNRNPKTSKFGRIYASNSTPGTSGGRAVGRGLYIMNADQSDALGRGNTASTAGVVFSSASASSPFMPGIGPDDLVYVNDFATPTATTWVFNPDITTSNVVLAGVGEAANPTVHTDSMNHPIVRGTLAGGNLQLWNVDGSYPPWNCMLRWDINAGPLPWNTPPSAVLGTAGNLGVADLTTDMDLGPDGKFYTCMNRSAGTDTSSIKVYDTDGTTQLWGSLTALGSPDPLRLARSIQVSLDGKYLAVTHDDFHISVILLTNGIPDAANILTITQTGLSGVGRSVAWDVADNVYMVAGTTGSGFLRAWSIGATTTTITSNDATCTNGTFQLVTPPTTVSVVATQPDAHEAGPVNGVFTITRTDPDLSQSLLVNYAFAGTAVLGKNYTSSATNSIVIAPGQASTNVTIIPVSDGSADPTLTVILNLKGGGSYSAAAPITATVTIADNSTPFFQITALSTNVYEGNPYDYARATIVRWGDTNQTVVLDTPSFTYTGTAVPNMDYYVTNLPVTFNPGDVTQTVQLLYPINNNSFDFAKTIKVGMAAGSGYTVSNSTFTTTLVESTLPTETVLWSDDLHSDTSGNWTQFFASLNPATADYTVNWAYDYSRDLIPPAPHSGTDTHGLRMTVNKGGNTQAAALNFYPMLSTSSYSNEMMQFDLSGGTLPAGFKLRESPTLASTGRTTIQPATGGGYTIHSFFDVWLELSPDNGMTWIADGSGSPCHLVLYGPDTNWWSGNSLPPLTGYYTNDSNLWQGNFSAYQVKNLVNANFTANFAPSLPGVLQTGSYGSTAAFQLSTDYGGTFNDYAATGALTVTTTNMLSGTTNFGGNYALRFDMYLTVGSASTTEYVLFGINHSGTKTNWFRNSAGGVPGGWAFDGLWYDIESDGAALGDYVVYSSPTLTNTTPTVYPTSYNSRGASTLTGVFKSPPWSGAPNTYPGVPSNDAGSVTPGWAQVEINQIGNLVTWKINNTVIFTITNAPPYNTNAYYTNGNIMLGYCDGYDSVGTPDASVIYANVQVVQLGLPAIASQPISAVTPAGGTTNLTVVASTGTGITNYQWFKNGTAVAGATGSTLAFPAVVLANYGTYTVSVFDGTYTSLSSAATLTPPAPSILINPSNVVAAAGTATNMTVTAVTYTGVTNFQWYSNNVSVGTSGTTRTYSFTANPAFFTTNKVTVSDGFTTPVLTSSTARVLPPAPVINTPPANRVGAAPGGSVTFSVTATSYSGKSIYQWLTNNVPITGATAATLTLNNLQSPASFLPGYAVSFNDGYNPAITSAPPASLTLAVRQSLSQSVAGTTLSLSFGSEVGPGYVTEYKTNLNDATWKGLKTNAGTGGTITVTDSLVAAPTRFYRIRMQ